MPEKATKAVANYREGEGDQRCKNCTMYHPSNPNIGSCDSVKGVVGAEMLCDYFEAK